MMSEQTPPDLVALVRAWQQSRPDGYVADLRDSVQFGLGSEADRIESALLAWEPALAAPVTEPRPLRDSEHSGGCGINWDYERSRCAFPAAPVTSEMPPIEVGDVVEGHQAGPLVAVDGPITLRYMQQHPEQIVAVYKRVWTREGGK